MKRTGKGVPIFPVFLKKSNAGFFYKNNLVYNIYCMLNIYNPNNHNGNKTAGLVSNGKAEAVKGKIIKPDFSKYQDPTQEFSSQELKYSLWYVRHKALLYKILIGSLMAINASFIIFGLWKWGSYLWGWQDHARLQAGLTSFVNYSGMHPRFGALPAQVAGVQILPSRENKFDAVAEMANPNDRFLINFDYYFLVGDVKTPTQKSFLLPGEIRLVAALGIKDSGGVMPELVMENVTYERVSAHQISIPKDWQSERLNFKLGNFIFLKSLQLEGQNTDAIKFDLTNDSPYDYVAANFYVGLLQNGQVVGILPLYLDSIKSLETKNIDLRNFVSGLNITDLALYPLINVYNEEVYLKP